MEYCDLSKEQQDFVGYALAGYSILVDACIGSGKTTAIQVLCNLFDRSKSVLYLTYNKLLKLDAKARINGYNIDTTNYHGFAYRELVQSHHATSVQECIINYVRIAPKTRHYDVLILDEYQDIDSEIAQMLKHIKNCNPGLQIIAVGDMSQKIYDRTRLDAMKFIVGFLPKNHMKLEFTVCFRLSSDHAAMLGDIWGKKIVGVNDNCEIQIMSKRDAYSFLSAQEPGSILCLGSNTGDRSRVLNMLEDNFPEKFNKNTVWSKIGSQDGGVTEPRPGVAIFTTYDGCKGMERDICVVFDWDETYWSSRISKPNARYEILRNIFCVAASRGKRKIIFVTSAHKFLSKQTLMTDTGVSGNMKNMAISGMFDFKFTEDVEDAYNVLALKRLQAPGRVIDIPVSDAMIDLSPCVGIYQEAAYFRDYNIDEFVKQYFELNDDLDYQIIEGYESWTMEQKVLYLTALMTRQNRYWYQVSLPFVQPDKYAEIAGRLCTRLPSDAVVQSRCEVVFYNQRGGQAFSAIGMSGAEDSGCLYELKFVNELAHSHFLQTAMYMIARKYKIGRLWNVRTDELWEVQIPDEQEFLNRVARAVTKGRLKMYYNSNSGGLLREPKTQVFQGPDYDIVLASVQSSVTRTRAAGLVASATTKARKKALSLCVNNPELTARAICAAMNPIRKTDKQRADAVWSVFRDAGFQPIFVAETTFYRHFRDYMQLIAQAGPA